MKKRNFGIVMGLFAVSAFAVLAGCTNPIIETWWAEDPAGTERGPDAEIGVGGSGANFGLVVFDADGGIPGPRALQIAWDGTIGRLRPVERNSFGFVGWFDENGDPWDTETRQVKPGDDADDDGFITLKARWSGVFHTVTFVATPSPQAVPSQAVAAGAKIVPPVNPAGLGDGRGFAGWWERDGSGGDWGRLWDFPRDTVNAPLTLYARWEYGTRTVELKTNGGTRPDGTAFTRTRFTVPVSFGVVQDPGPIVREGHSFGGWFTGAGIPWDFATSRVTEIDLVPGVDPLVIYAEWIGNVYIVSFAARSSTASQPGIQEVPHGGLVARPAITNHGAVLLGWYADANLSRAWDFGRDAATSNMILYADWEVSPETILRQIRIINVSFIDFAGNSTTYNQKESVPVGGTHLTDLQIANNGTTLAEVVRIMSENPGFLLQLAGHANPTTQNMEAELPELEALSRARADSVMREIVGSHGLNAARLINVGFNPRNLTNDADHASLNRCVELVIIEILES